MYKNKTILLIDDNRAIRYLTRLSLLEENVNSIVFEATNGHDALMFLISGEICPDVILLDINMPKVDGHEFLLEYKKHQLHLQKASIYILTTSIMDGEYEKILNTGIVKGYFEKPLSKTNIEKIKADLAIAV